MDARTPDHEQREVYEPGLQRGPRAVPRKDPTPQYVYWIRRAVALLLVVLVVVLLVLVIKWFAGLFSNDDSSSQGPGAGTAQGAAAGKDTSAKGADNGSDKGTQSSGAQDAQSQDDSASGDAGAPASCNPADIVLALSADDKSLSLGEKAEFQVDLSYSGKERCIVDLGATKEVLTITSGTDRIWSSADCESDDSRPYYMQQSARAKNTISWSGVRSDEKCSSGLPKLKAGTYRAVASYEKVESNELVFTIGE